jgi:hypothetical protein
MTVEADDSAIDPRPAGGQDPRTEFMEGDWIKIDSDGDGLIFSHDGATGSDEGWAQETLH